MTDLTITLPTNTTLTSAPPLIGAQRRSFLTPISDSPGSFLLVCDNTGMEKIKRCHNAANNYLVLGRESHVKDAALVFGGAVHDGLELFHHWQVNPDDSVNGPAAQDAAIRAYFVANPCPPDSFRTVENALTVLAEYRRRCNINLHPDYEWQILCDASGVPIIEEPFELPLDVIEVDAEIPPYGHVAFIHLAWSGRIDQAVFVNTRNSISDNKTTTIWTDDYVQGYQLSSQTRGYLWAGRQLWPELDLQGFCLNAIYINKKAAIGATLAGRSLADRGPRGGEAPLAFYRSYFDYSPENLTEWANDQVTFVEDFIHSLVRQHTPLNDRACFDKFGRCPYHDVCLMPADVRELYLKSDAFRQVTWNPVA